MKKFFHEQRIFFKFFKFRFSPFSEKKKKNVSIGTTIFFRSPDNFWSTWPAWNEHRFKTRASGEGEGWWGRRVDCVSRQAAPLRARCAVTRHAPFTPIATNTCITAAVSKFAPPSTLTHCPPPPLHSGHFTWNDNHPRQNDPIASRNNIAKISYKSEKLWTALLSFILKIYSRFCRLKLER